MSQAALPLYTMGKTSGYGRAVVDRDILAEAVMRAARQRLTVTEVVHRALCNEFGLDPANPSRRLPSKRTKQLSAI